MIRSISTSFLTCLTLLGTACGRKTGHNDNAAPAGPDAKAQELATWTGFYQVQTHTRSIEAKCTGDAKPVSGDDQFFTLTAEQGIAHGQDVTILAYYSCTGPGTCKSDPDSERSLFDRKDGYWTGTPSSSSSGGSGTCLLHLTTTEARHQGASLTLSIRQEAGEVKLGSDCLTVDLETVVPAHKAELACEELETVVAVKQ